MISFDIKIILLVSLTTNVDSIADPTIVLI